MNTAKATRQQMYLTGNVVHKMTIHRLKDQLDDAIKASVNRGLLNASVTIAEDVDPDLINGLKCALVKLGYKVKLELKPGIFDESMVRMPRTMLTLSWG